MCVVVRFATLDIGDLSTQIQLANQVSFTVVQVDGFWIDQLRPADGVDVGDDLVRFRQLVPGLVGMPGVARTAVVQSTPSFLDT